jgi:hypothetical protein
MLQGASGPERPAENSFFIINIHSKFSGKNKLTKITEMPITRNAKKLQKYIVKTI